MLLYRQESDQVHSAKEKAERGAYIHFLYLFLDFFVQLPSCWDLKPFEGFPLALFHIRSLLQDGIIALFRFLIKTDPSMFSFDT